MSEVELMIVNKVVPVFLGDDPPRTLELPLDGTMLHNHYNGDESAFKLDLQTMCIKYKLKGYIHRVGKGLRNYVKMKFCTDPAFDLEYMLKEYEKFQAINKEIE
ncbi:hypothetical protein LCGC14_1323680 [marine sediment metagenome]|uniref:Uncharacterized protein n=1 Tax=marine sediment metagenome TaxID=412755 RepID=A0A0F9KIR5_9ZZZZ|nr:hypothetical protein [Pricia sp.]